MAASDYVPNLSKYRLHPKGRPQMESVAAVGPCSTDILGEARVLIAAWCSDIRLHITCLKCRDSEIDVATMQPLNLSNWLRPAILGELQSVQNRGRSAAFITGFGGPELMQCVGA